MGMSLFDYKKNGVTEVKEFNFGIKIYLNRNTFGWISKDRIYCQSEYGIVTEGDVFNPKTHYAARLENMEAARELLYSLESTPEPTTTPAPVITERSIVMQFAWQIRDQYKKEKKSISWGEAQSMAWAIFKTTKKIENDPIALEKGLAIKAAEGLGVSETLSWEPERKERYGRLILTCGVGFAQESWKKGKLTGYLSGRAAMPAKRAAPLYV